MKIFFKVLFLTYGGNYLHCPWNWKNQLHHRRKHRKLYITNNFFQTTERLMINKLYIALQYENILYVDLCPRCFSHAQLVHAFH